MMAAELEQEAQDTQDQSLQDEINGTLNDDALHEMRTQAEPVDDIADDEEDDDEEYDDEEEDVEDEDLEDEEDDEDLEDEEAEDDTDDEDEE